MAYVELPPAPALRPYVECYWISTTEPGRERIRILPDGCCDLIVPIAPNGADAPQPYVVGTMTSARLHHPTTHALGVRFWPGGIYPLLQQPLTAFTDAVCPLPDVVSTTPGLTKRGPTNVVETARFTTFAGLAWPDLAWPDQAWPDQPWPDQPWPDQPWPDRVRALEQALLAWFTGNHVLGNVVAAPVHYVVTALQQSDGQRRVATLATDVGLSERHLERLFERYVGVSPKLLAQLIRFRAVCERLRQPPADSLLSVAAELGFTDHAHLTRQFRRFAGVAPTQFRRQ